ncbi:flagellar motor switch protein FliN [Bosea sp. BH3]|nr:flagellar motor switch protein FliN [Bosea sp. BH3]
MQPSDLAVEEVSSPLEAGITAAAAAEASATGEPLNLDAVMRIPVTIQVVLGSASMQVANLMKLRRGAVVPLDHRVGEPVDVVVNGRVVARGEVVVVEDDNSRFGVSLTEIVGVQSKFED